jgi:hypothetical protein
MARLLDFELATAYAVRDEVLVGKLPLRVDILLIRREAGELSQASRRDLSSKLRISVPSAGNPTDPASVESGLTTNAKAQKTRPFRPRRSTAAVGGGGAARAERARQGTDVA